MAENANPQAAPGLATLAGSSKRQALAGTPSRPTPAAGAPRSPAPSQRSAKGDAQHWTRRIAEERVACEGWPKEQRQAHLARIYDQATKAVGAERGGARIWVEYATLQAETSPEDGRDIFKLMKRNGIGMDDSAFHVAWAELEASEGNTDKALSILDKARNRGARLDQAAITSAMAKIGGKEPLSTDSCDASADTVAIVRGAVHPTEAELTVKSRAAASRAGRAGVRTGRHDVVITGSLRESLLVHRAS